MKTKLLLGIFLLTTICCSNLQPSKELSSLPHHQGRIKITGAFALYPLAQQWIADYQKLNPDIEFDLQAIGSGNGLIEVLTGETDIAMISSQIPAEQDTTLWISPVARLAVVPIISKRILISRKYLKQELKETTLETYSLCKTKKAGAEYMANLWSIPLMFMFEKINRVQLMC